MEDKHIEQKLFCKAIQESIVYSCDIVVIRSANRGIIGTNKTNVYCSGFDKCNKEKCIRRNSYGKEDYTELT